MKLLVTQHMLEKAKANKSIGVYAMHPKEFLELTTSGSVDSWVAGEPNFSVAEYNKFSKAGKTLMPFLDVELESGKVRQHEGRHRAAALLAEGETSMDVAITLLNKNLNPIYYTEPYGDDLNHPKRFVKKYLSTWDLPLAFLGQFKHYRHSVMTRSFKPFYPDTPLQAIARLKATKEEGSLKDSVNFIQYKAKEFLGDCEFDPPSGVTLISGQLVMYVRHSNVSLKSVGMFAKTVRNANLNPRVVQIFSDKDAGKQVLKIVLEKA